MNVILLNSDSIHNLNNQLKFGKQKLYKLAAKPILLIWLKVGLYIYININNIH